MLEFFTTREECLGTFILGSLCFKHKSVISFKQCYTGGGWIFLGTPRLDHVRNMSEG